MPDAPSAVLSRAADLIRDTAALANADEWTFEAFAPAVRWAGDARWIALMSPAVAGPVSAMRRRAASDYVVFVAAWKSRPRPEDEVARLIEEQFGGALALARAVLGEKEEQ